MRTALFLALTLILVGPQVAQAQAVPMAPANCYECDPCYQPPEPCEPPNCDGYYGHKVVYLVFGTPGWRLPHAECVKPYMSCVGHPGCGGQQAAFSPQDIETLDRLLLATWQGDAGAASELLAAYPNLVTYEHSRSGLVVRSACDPLRVVGFLPLDSVTLPVS